MKKVTKKKAKKPTKMNKDLEMFYIDLTLFLDFQKYKTQRTQEEIYMAIEAYLKATK